MAEDGDNARMLETAADGGDPSVLKIHLERLLPVVMDADPSDVRNSLFTSNEAIDRLRRFTSDPGLQALYILKERTDLAKLGAKGEVEDDGRSSAFLYSLALELNYTDKHVAALVLIKRTPVIESTRPLQNQLQLIILPGPSDGGNAFETLHSYIHNAVSPFFDAYLSAKAVSVQGVSAIRDDKDSKTGIPMAKKKIAELELSLLQLQQNVEIPEISLSIHPVVQRAVEKYKGVDTKRTVDAVGDIVNDSQFLNKLQADVNGWIKEIQRVTKIQRDPATGTASQEINFWLSMERALAQIEEQLKSEFVVLTLDILKHAKRFHATVSFLADTGLKEAAEKVQKYNQLMRDFPLNELLSATDVDKIRESLGLIFGHLNKKLKLSPYPIKRALPLVGAISKDLNEQLLKVLGNRRLMYLDYEEFEKATNGCEDVFRAWDEQTKEFTNVAREVTRKRSEKILPMKINNAHSKLQERINFIRAFRRQHEQLHNTILKVMKPDKLGASDKGGGVNLSDVNALDDVNLAYESVKSIDVLDVSPDGTEIWVSAENSYNERVSRVENQIIARLRDRLGTAKNANEMFRVFSKFNALFVRPKIRGAIQEYQTQLIENVKDDIKKLHDKFKTQYGNSEAYHMSQVRDLPPISGAIIWAKQIERQLGLYMKRVEDVLGKGWELYAEGQKLQSESNSFRKRLETKPICDQWLAEITKKDLNVSGRIFEITRNRAILSLGINFDSQIITLFKEVRNLLWFGYQIPHTVANVAKDAKRVYPYAVSLSETVRTYTQTVAKVNKNAVIVPLVAAYRKDVQAHISKGIQLRWDYFVNTYDARPFSSQSNLNENFRENRHVIFVREFASIVSVFQDKVNSAISIFDEIKLAIEELKSSVFSNEKFQDILDKIQRLIDRLNLESYSNLDSWTSGLDLQIEDVLAHRLQFALQSWVKEFQSQTLEQNFLLDAKRRTRARRGTIISNSAEEMRKDDIQKPLIKQIVHEIRLKNQSMYLDPPLEFARQNFYRQLHEWLAVVCDLRRIQSSRYDISIEKSIEKSLTYTNLLVKLQDNAIFSAYGAIESMLAKVSNYVGVWLQYQSLWDLENEYVYAKLGEDLGKWQQLVLEIKKARATFDNSETEKSFGVVVIDYEQVQSKVNAKYDQWQREILNRFGTKLGISMKDFFSLVSQARSELELQSVEGNSTAEAVSFITFVQDLKRKLPQWTADVEIFRQSQKVLERQRFLFPSDWLFLDNVEGEWSAFNEILSRKNLAIQEQIGGLQMKIIAEEKIIKQKIEDILGEWNKDKPVKGDIKPNDATNFLSAFETRVNRIKEEYDLVCRAREALDLELVTDNRLDPLVEELKDLKGVWISLSQVWTSLYEIKDTLWSSVVARKTKQQLDVLLSSTKDMPNKMRQYAAFEFMQETLKSYLKINTLLADLKSEALRDRHWKQIFKVLKFEGSLTFIELTLGHLWDADVKKYEASLREIVVMAQGEMALEEFIRMVRENWTSYSLELVNYQNKCRLIRGWDDLFAKCSEHLNSLTAMKHSPYYKVFEEEASSWEDKLNRIHLLFDVWIDVQRQWVYLEGIFTGNTDIKQLLPIESQRFQNINLEFMNAMKKVYKSPLVLDVLNVPGIQKSLERLADLLSKIQKALGEYLERERSSFPRFYFVGDEDLLDIIGNSKDVIRIQKHFKKMFAGISRILLSEDNLQILGLVSKEGEEVSLKYPIVIKDHSRINDWLLALEKEMKRSLALILGDSLESLNSFYFAETLSETAFMDWIEKFPSQLVILSAQMAWTHAVEKSFAEKNLEGTLQTILRSLTLLADIVLRDLPAIRRRKCEHLITELVHQRDVVRALIKNGASNAKEFAWLYQMRFYWNEKTEDPLQRLTIKMANATFFYGFEYLGVADRLVQTPLTDRCYLTMTQALDSRLGGSPFGPAGTGKTESVKALGCQLGRFVLVFCCDENFDFQAMGRIFIGLCQVGAWGCFDEFNRLEERILSAVSQQIQTIQLGLKDGNEVELVNKSLKINTDTGIFITMNPGYAGRSNLPDNLKKLFRSIAMTHPDRELIAQVMLYSQGFRTAELLASKVVPLFNLCSEQLSTQSHYDFGLRSLKSVLVSAGNLKRDRLNNAREAQLTGSALEEISGSVKEQEIVIQSIRETLVPKLVAEDIPLLQSLLSDVFPGVDYAPVDLEKLKECIMTVCKRRNLIAGEFWLEKVIQLYQIQSIHHGLMMVGPSGSGKSSAWRVLIEALELADGTEGSSYVIDPKAIPKDALYGSMDNTTREWTDGLFTHILRKIIDNVRGESLRRHWILFDGDVDPEWVENLNSVLDDNKLLTLPNGERLSLPPNVRIMFEVETLRYATLATVSRCGMVWFSEEVVTEDMVFENYLENLKSISLEEGEEENASRRAGETSTREESLSLLTQKRIADILSPYFRPQGLVSRCLGFVMSLEHIMDFTRMRVLGTLFSLLNKAVRNVLDYNSSHPDFPLASENLDKYMSKKLVLSLVWSFSGDSKFDFRNQFGEFLRTATSVDMPLDSSSVLDFDVDLTSGDWWPWHSRVPTIEIETHNVSAADVVIPTVDTLRHEEVLYSWLSEHKPLLLCGPPGSGKTMTLFAALRKLPDMEVVGLNFSSASSPELILKTFEQYCEYRKTPTGVVLAPQLIGRWLVLFCDEINLPAADKYGTQRVISFIRQLVEHGGFWRASDKTWVKLERIQFVGACNPPTDPGRVPLSHRFLRHAPLLFVDYPGEVSLYQIYSTFSRAMLKVAPNLRAYSDPLTYAMIEFFLKSQRRFTPDIQSHYIYSPRELTRWIRGIFEVLKTSDLPNLQDLVRLWAHEGLRLFQDRLVTEDERKWTDDAIDEIALKHFPNLGLEALKRPILFSNWLSKHYIEVARDELRDFVKARLKVFYEEELDVPIVLFNDVLDHVLRIDRVFRQMQGHLLLIGVSGAGKTTLSRFVAWMNGLSVFQIKVHNKYSAADFDEDLRIILRRTGCKGEKICFIMDESNVLDSGFLERMNTLLANAEIPGLFEGDEYASLMTQCKEGAQREGLMLDSSEELYKWFTQQVMKNLHIVFTMNPPEGGLASRAATSPALFNRCVLDWFGDWSDQAFYQVGKEFTDSLDLDLPSYMSPLHFPVAYRDLSLPPTYRAAVINAFVFVHQSLYEVNNRLSRRQGRSYHVTPRHYLDFINQFVKLFIEKREDLEEQQRHLNVGLDKLRDTVVKVEELRRSLAIKKAELELKNDQANEKLKKMVADQQEAEQQKASSLRIQEELSKQNTLIDERRRIVMSDLADAEPAVEEAQRSVSSIKKQHLTEVRAMGNPPEAVKIAMESVCILLGHKIDSWKTVQAIIRKDDFITSIVNYNTDKMTQRIRDEIRNAYLSNPVFNFESVNRASKACGPLVQWVSAQVRYAEILEKVGPLRQEVLKLENSAEATKQQAANIENMILELESSIGHYKDEYAVLISETQALKTEMETVKSRVDRSLALLGNLSSENERWGQASQSFESQMGTIVGDVLLSSAYLAYGGFFDQQYREALMQRWISHLEAANVRFKSDISIPEYLSTADERLYWQENQLPADDLCTENAIMLKRFNRYPLIIDPSGQASSFLLNIYKSKKIMVTSFLDDSFLKVLESALRFGNPLLVQDVENLDPILNAVLNKEIRRTGGRVLIRLGGQDIDFSPSFTLFLSTRDPSVNFPPDICSRVTFVNFTVTRSSLQSQCLHQVLKAERPDTDRKRTDLIKLRGEFQLRLRHLEKSLLQALNDSKGNILEDDNIIATLEKLKQEAAEVTKKVEDTDIVMQEVDSVTATYTPLAQACSSIFFCLEQLSLLHHFYQFSLDFFLDIFQYLLHDNPKLVGVNDYNERLARIFDHLFGLTYQRAARSLLHEDQLVFAMQLAQIKSRATGSGLDEDEFDLLISGEDLRDAEKPVDPLLSSNFGEDVGKRMLQLTSKPAFSSLSAHIKDNLTTWQQFWKHDTPESNVPSFWQDKLSNANIALRKLLLIKAFRPDRLLPATLLLAESSLDSSITSSAELDLKSLVFSEIKGCTPLAFCSVPGYDASKMVEEFASNCSQKIVGVAMGSAEGYTLAETAISTGVKTGTWVLLKNVHLSPAWLSQLEKRLHSMKSNDNFRLFLTMETNPRVPVNLLRLSRVLMFEPPPGIKANLNATIARIPAARLAKGPVERNRLYFLLAWLHAVVQERLRYVPIGWTKSYEFNESDYDMALTVVDSWLDDAASGRSNIAPERIPFDAIKSLLTETVYGGKIDNSFDQVLLESFVNSLFGSFCFDINFALVNAHDGGNKLIIPEGTRMDQILQWVSGLPDQQPPSWLGLPSNAERVLMAARGFETLSKVRKMKQALDDFENIVEKADGGSKLSSLQPSWMKAVQASVLDWLSFLPEKLVSFPGSKEAIMDPLQRYFEREHKIGSSLLKAVRNDLHELKDVCEGKVKQTNNTRQLVDCITKGVIPSSWNRYKVSKTASLSFWIGDFKQRLDQIALIAKSQDFRSITVWIGGLFLPEAFATATRQNVSQRNGWSLEELSLKVHIAHAPSDNAFKISGLRLAGAEWTGKAVRLSSEVFTKLQEVSIEWVKGATRTPAGVPIPVYLNGDRSDLLFVANLETDEGAISKIVQHAVAVLASYRPKIMSRIDDDDDYDEDASTPQFSSMSAADLEAFVQARAQDVRSYLARGAYSDAVKKSLENPPLGKDIQSIKDRNLQTVMEALAAVKASDIPNLIKALSPSDIDVLMKFIYRGFASPDLFNSALLLAWHEKAVETGGIGSIMRVLTDRSF
ncbi:hypothetical protein HDU67_003972 [Dinochytrium kinnereticum]|nr:hypothetical protein HDU67_003972 [Dinochytrium kinnereticum]